TPKGPPGGADRGSAAAHRDQDDHLEGGQPPDPRGGDDAALADVERPRHPGQARGDREDEELESGRRVAAEKDARLAVANGHQYLARRGVDDVAAEQIRPAQAEGGAAV